MTASNQAHSNVLSNEEIERYSRQLLLPNFEVEASVVVVGMGGLGCPVSLYLATAGLARLGLIDYDNVELGNIHRQILHSERRVGTSKVSSAIEVLTQLNSSCIYERWEVLLDASNALDILKRYDVIVDASDNMPTRYLLSDAAILLKKPLVSGSALKWDGHITTYNYKHGPCYRCLYPIPMNPLLVTNCSDGGVLGPITGVIGNLQALEVIHVILGKSNYTGKMLVFDGYTGTFKTMKLREKQKSCIGCNETKSILPPLIDYKAFCQSSATDKSPSLRLLQEDERILVEDYLQVVNKDQPHILLDVRESLQYNICSLSNSINIPLAALDKELHRINFQEDLPIYVICRRGNDSQTAVMKLKSVAKENVIIKDITGGLEAWSVKIDPSFPKY